MRIVFITPEAENYAVMLFSALLKKEGHDVHLIFDPRLFANDELNNSHLSRFFDISRQNLNKIIDLNPDFVAFSVYTQDYRWALDYAKQIKYVMPSTKIIFGGIHCVLCPDEVNKHAFIDYVCTGEGEEFIVNLLNGKDVDPGCLRDELTDLNTLPFPDKDLLFDQKGVFKRDYSIATSRGCPFNCAFCASSSLNKKYKNKYLRQRSVDHVIQELLLAKAKYSPKSIYFTDDNLTLNTEWLGEFSRAYKILIGLPFYCTANPGHITEEQIVLLKKSGCQMIGFGLQSTDEDYRKKVFKRGGSNEHIKKMVKLCKSLGISYSFDHICMGDEDEQVSLRFYNETRPDIINSFSLVYLPGTYLTSRLPDEDIKRINQGYLKTSMLNRDNDWFTSMCAVLPLLHPRVVDWLLDTGLYKWVRLPFFFRLFFKDISRLKIGRYSDVFFPIRLLLVNMRDNLRIKYFNK